MHNRPSVIFDLDGTLIDSVGDIAFSVAWVLRQRGLAPLAIERIHRLIGRPPQEIFAAAGLHDHEDLKAAVIDFRRHLREHLGRHSSTYPGVGDLLSSLRDAGALIGIATTKPTSLAAAAIGAAGLIDHIDHVQGTDAFPPKPAPDVVLRCLRALNSQHGVMVGDTPDDVLAGRAAGLWTVAVLHGTRSEAELRSVAPDFVIPKIAALAGIPLFVIASTGPKSEL